MMVQAQRLYDGDTHKWVERIATNTNKSSGWLSTQRSLEAQGYSYGNRDLWLPKPEFISYKVPSKTTIPKGGQPRKRASSKIYKDWIVPHNLSSAQGYYDGPTQLWVPKDANHSQEGSSSLHEIQRPKQSNQIIQQRPVKSNASISNNKVSSSQL